MGLFSSSKSSSSSSVDSSATTAAGDSSVGIRENSGTVSYASSDPQVVADALAAARGIAADALTTQREVFALARDAQKAVTGGADSALAAVLSAKTDAGQSERLVKIIAAAVVAAVGLLVFMRKG